MKREVFCLLLLPAMSWGQARSPEGGSDSYYQVFSSAGPNCSYSFVDIATTGTILSFSAPYRDAGDPPADDDGGAVLSLSPGFLFYGQTRSTAVVSPNGYVAFASGFQEEDGRDFSPDSSLPAVPTAYFPSGSRVFAASARLYPFHQDLTVASGGVFWQSFDPCPRPSEALGNEPCTVLQWQDVQVLDSAEPLRFQVLLYHQSGEFVFQYQLLDSNSGAEATVGWQEDLAQRGFAWSARQPGGVHNGLALCTFAPHYPPGGPQADLEASLIASAPDPMDTSPFPLELQVSNSGPSTATAVLATLLLPPGLSPVTDPCGVSAGWSLASLASQSLVTCTVTVQADASFTGGDVVLQLVASTQDPSPANNTATLTLAAADDGDGVAPTVEDSYPGGDGFPRFTKGDGNGDGVPDRQQATVATLPLASGKGWVTVDVTGCSALQQVSTVTEAGSGITDPQFDFPWGLVRFVVPCPSATVKLLWHSTGMPQPTYRGFGPWQTWKTLAATRVRDRWVWGTLLALEDGAPGDSQPGDSQLTHLGGPAKPAAFPGRR